MLSSQTESLPINIGAMTPTRRHPVVANLVNVDGDLQVLVSRLTMEGEVVGRLVTRGDVELGAYMSHEVDELLGIKRG